MLQDGSALLGQLFLSTGSFGAAHSDSFCHFWLHLLILLIDNAFLSCRAVVFHHQVHLCLIQLLLFLLMLLLTLFLLLLVPLLACCCCCH
jgi:hypothetical protein